MLADWGTKIDPPVPTSFLPSVGQHTFHSAPSTPQVPRQVLGHSIPCPPPREWPSLSFPLSPFILKASERTSLVAQWLRIHLPVWEVQYLVPEDPTCLATTTEPQYCSTHSPHSATKAAPACCNKRKPVQQKYIKIYINMQMHQEKLTQSKQ